MNESLEPSERAIAWARELARQETEPGWTLTIVLPNGAQLVGLFGVTRGAALKALTETALQYPTLRELNEFLRVSLCRYPEPGGR